MLKVNNVQPNRQVLKQDNKKIIPKKKKFEWPRLDNMDRTLDLTTEAYMGIRDIRKIRENIRLEKSTLDASGRHSIFAYGGGVGISLNLKPINIGYSCLFTKIGPSDNEISGSMSVFDGELFSYYARAEGLCQDHYINFKSQIIPRLDFLKLGIGFGYRQSDFKYKVSINHIHSGGQFPIYQARKSSKEFVLNLPIAAMQLGSHDYRFLPNGSGIFINNRVIFNGNSLKYIGYEFNMGVRFHIPFFSW